MVTRREEFEKEAEASRKEIRDLERRLAKREESFERRESEVQKRDRKLADQEKRLQNRQSSMDKRVAELDRRDEEINEKLLEVAGLTREDAKAEVFRVLERDLQAESSKFIERHVEQTREEARDAGARGGAHLDPARGDHRQLRGDRQHGGCAHDEMKGRIIGREGRNIRAFEKATGVDVIVDDTPGVIVVSAFDGVRREVARRAMEQLIHDGRVHPSRIEEVVAQMKREMDQHLKETGKKALLEVGLHNMHGKLIDLLGRLKFRTSYGQNVLEHLIETAHLCASIAAEMKLDVKLAKRAAFLHDIGKAIDHEAEGGHPALGADIARRCGENKTVVNAIASHHDDVPKESIYAVLTQVCDALSAGRPGARRETFDRYVERLQRLEDVASAFPASSRCTRSRRAARCA